jgi:hypothetical protein
MEAAAPSISTVRELTLPPQNAVAVDVRWATDKSVFVANFNNGVSEVDLNEPSKQQLLLPGGALSRPQSGPARSLALAEFLGVSRDYILVGAPMRQIVWKPRSGEQFVQDIFANALDVDVWNDRAVVLGVRGDSYGKWGSVGPTLWLVSLTPEHAFFQPVSSVPPESMHKCGFQGVGAVRFYPDGRFVVAAGVQPGIELYDATGHLIRRWRTDPLNIDDKCSVTEAQADSFADFEVRAEWLNRRHVIDEILPLPEGPLVIIRERRGDLMTWRGVLLPFNGDPVPVAIPINSPSLRAHLHADLRGDRIAFVVGNLGTPGGQARIVIGRVSR